MGYINIVWIPVLFKWSCLLITKLSTALCQASSDGRCNFWN